MRKVISWEENLNRRYRKDGILYSEQYEVNYWIQKPDGMWKKDSRMYCTDGRADHQRVQDRWEKDMAGENVTLINVTYQ